MAQFELSVEQRSDRGKRVSRRLHRVGKLPGIVYGSNKDATPITLGHDEVMHQLEHEAFFSHILTLNFGRRKEKVVLKDLQRHPFKPTLLHIDFQRINENKKLTMRVPLHFLNEDICIGVKSGGGIINHAMTDIEVSCLPKHLPEYIEVDMQAVELGSTIHLGDLELPETVDNNSLVHGGDPLRPVVTVQLPKVVVEEEEVAEGEEEIAAVAGEEAPDQTQTDDN